LQIQSVVFYIELCLFPMRRFCDVHLLIHWA
jgi:hypothetical protein